MQDVGFGVVWGLDRESEANQMENNMEMEAQMAAGVPILRSLLLKVQSWNS